MYDEDNQGPFKQFLYLHIDEKGVGKKYTKFVFLCHSTAYNDLPDQDLNYFDRSQASDKDKFVAIFSL